MSVVPDISGPAQCCPGCRGHIPYGLTGREIQIIESLAFGLTNKQIASQLELSPLTVKAHLSRISSKMKVGERAGIVGLAYRSGILTLP